MNACLRLVCLLAMLMAGCSGSGGDAALGDDPNNNSSTTLEGRLMFTNIDNKSLIIDLSTGNVSLVPGVQVYGDPSGREYASLWKAYAHAQPYSGDRFILTVDSCKFDEDDDSQLFSLDHCLALHEANGTEIAAKKFYGWSDEIRGSAVLSFDGNYIAAIINHHWILIYDSQLNLVSRFETPQSTIKGVLWRPDNSLIYYDNDEIFSTAPLDAEGSRILKIETDTDDNLGTLNVSPDGETLAFQFGGEIHLMNLSTGEVRLVPVVEQLRLNWSNVTSWSPDGQSLMLYAKGTGLVLTFANHNIIGENIVIPVNFGLPGLDGNTVLDFTPVMAKTALWERSGSTNESALLEVLSENSQAYWLR